LMIAENALNLLEFPKLLRIISTYSHSSATEKEVLSLHPLGDRGEIGTRLGQIAEIRRISHEGSPLRLSPFSDIDPLLEKLRPEGAVLESKELSAFMPFLSIVAEIFSQMKEQHSLPFLAELTAPLTGFPHILTVLKKSMDTEGNILDSASPALAELRRQVRSLEGRITKRLEEMTRDERMSVFLQDSFITERSGRWVIPVRMDSKGQVSGVVHDVSRSGETAFIEPLAIIGLSNERENLMAELKTEEIRILRNICSQIRAVAQGMRVQHRTLVHLDLLNCIAGFADELHMENPEINDAGSVRVVDGRHPLLMLGLRKPESPQEVVPLNVRLGDAATVMVITGSNAGGKTIAIKTIGLLQLMALTGMPVAADSSSSFPLIHDLLIDIGDEQSIENNLSTFSAHISNISSILRKADRESLILIDELGTGTDPEEGAALACAVLTEIRSRGALLFATTHLTDIKGFVHRTEGMINASMEFDRNTLTPLYRLRVGEPGQSHALEIARKYGLPDSVIDSAKALLGGIKVEFDNLIADLNAKRTRYENALAELAKQQQESEEKSRLLEQRLKQAQTEQREALAKAYRDSSTIIAETRRQMNELLDEIRKKGREKGREVMKQTEAKQEEVQQKLREFDVADHGAPGLSDIKKGDIVFVRSFGYDASVMEVNERHNRLKVRSGNIEIEVPLADIGFKRGKSAETKTGAVTLHRADETVSSRLNLVGTRVDEALSKLEPFLNHASLAGLSEVTVIHGFGTGILARAVREHLDGHPLVKRFRKGEQSEGGAGVTIATLS
jgi:DNA mismatch repair protein MutS2